jgi:hypothetical protein
MIFKAGVVVVEATPEMKRSWKVADDVTKRLLGRPLIVTSVHEGIHSINSLHYFEPERMIRRFAWDCRTRDLEQGEAMDYRDELADELGLDYDVVLEEDHIHVERDPAKREGEPLDLTT